MPHRLGAVTARTALAPIAASAADPPASSTARPAWVASESTVATMAFGACTVAAGTSSGSAGTAG